MAYSNSFTTGTGSERLVLKFTWEELRDHCDSKIKELQAELDRFGKLAHDDALKKTRKDIERFTIIRDHLPQEDQMITISNLYDLGYFD